MLNSFTKEVKHMMAFTFEQLQVLFAAMIEQLQYSHELYAQQSVRFPENVKEHRSSQQQAYAQCIGTLEGLENAGCITEADIVNFRNLAENYNGDTSR